MIRSNCSIHGVNYNFVLVFSILNGFLRSVILLRVKIDFSCRYRYVFLTTCFKTLWHDSIQFLNHKSRVLCFALVHFLIDPEILLFARGLHFKGSSLFSF